MASLLRTFPLLLLAACASVGQPAAEGGALEIEPAGAVLLVELGGAPASQVFSATYRHADGQVEDVTDRAIWSISRPALGAFQGAELVARGYAGGTAAISATVDGVSGEVPVTVKVRSRRIVSPAPEDAPNLFDAAAEDPLRAPETLYPEDETVMPPNLSAFEAHWRDSAGNDLFEVALVSAFIDLRVYVVAPVPSDRWLRFLPAEWLVVQRSHAGEELEVIVRGLSQADPQVVGAAQAIRLRLATAEVSGGIYYWAAQSPETPDRGAIYRHDFGDPEATAELLYRSDDEALGQCVGCHALSRDGRRLAASGWRSENGAVEGTIFDVERGVALAPPAASSWRFAAYHPTGEWLVTSLQGSLTVRDPDGNPAAAMPGAGFATQPDFSPRGDAIAYVLLDGAPSQHACFSPDGTPGSPQDHCFTQGAIARRPFDPDTGAFGAPVVVVRATGPDHNVYYPAWSPDGEWILFNRSSHDGDPRSVDAYDDPTAEIYAVRAGDAGAPLRLDAANRAGALTNSWPRWAPFDHTSQAPSGDHEKIFWFTFSSRRAFGVRLADDERPQIWMAPFFPERAARGEEASGPAFWLPFQDIRTSNHIAQWSEEIVPIP